MYIFFLGDEKGLPEDKKKKKKKTCFQSLSTKLGVR